MLKLKPKPKPKPISVRDHMNTTFTTFGGRPFSVTQTGAREAYVMTTSTVGRLRDGRPSEHPGSSQAVAHRLAAAQYKKECAEQREGKERALAEVALAEAEVRLRILAPSAAAALAVSS